MITLSRHYASEHGWETMEDVARHEIAHALDYETRGKSDHGPRWKQWAMACGADPSRLYEGPAIDHSDSKYVGICPTCRKQHPYHRRLKRAHACTDCCRRYNGGRYSKKYALTLIERETGRPVTMTSA